MPKPLGPQFNPVYKHLIPYTELVPISVLKTLKGNELRYEGKALEELSEDIKKRGLLYPAMIQYNQFSRTAYMGEGHHRLAALEMAGYTHMPTTVSRVETDTKRGINVRGVEPDRHNYVPASLKLSQIMDYE